MKRISESALYNGSVETQVLYADVSECSTNTNTRTEEYATCTETTHPINSQRTNLTPTTNILSNKATTSSSSATQIPGEYYLCNNHLHFLLFEYISYLTQYIIVSTRSSQIDRTCGESSFESASSIHSSKGYPGAEESLQLNDFAPDSKYSDEMHLDGLHYSPKGMHIKTANHTFSSTSTIGSYNVGDEEILTENWKDNYAVNEKGNERSMPITTQHHSMAVLTKDEQNSEDDVHSELHYSSSGYYESPQNDGHCKTKFRRFRSEEERNRRKATMKLELDNGLSKVNVSSSNVVKRKDILMYSPDFGKANPLLIISSPLNIKRHRSKIRRQLRRPIKHENLNSMFQNATSSYIHQTKIDSVCVNQATATKGESNFNKDSDQVVKQNQIISDSKGTKTLHKIISPILQPISSTETISQLKTKSDESLNRSASPGSDSVFFSEAGCNHIIVESEQTRSISDKNENYNEKAKIPPPICSNSIESLAFNENEPDIVKPPSDFADSPIANKITQRLYKKVEKRIRSEDRYQGDRSRHYKTRKDNIRAKVCSSIQIRYSQLILTSWQSEERGQEINHKVINTLRLTGSSPSILPITTIEDHSHTIYVGHYDAARYARLNDTDLWAQLDHQKLGINLERK